jgi:hypothetical protein
VVRNEKIVSLNVVKKTDQLDKLIGKRSLKPYFNKKVVFRKLVTFLSQSGYLKVSEVFFELKNN